MTKKNITYTGIIHIIKDVETNKVHVSRTPLSARAYVDLGFRTNTTFMLTLHSNKLTFFTLKQVVHTNIYWFTYVGEESSYSFINRLLYVI